MDMTRECWVAYLEDALSDGEMGRAEQLLRESPEARAALEAVRRQLDRGEHSLGAIWRRERLSCPSRQELNGYLHGVLEPDVHKYFEFHLQVVECPYCLANLEDLRAKQAEPADVARSRRSKIFKSSAGMLPPSSSGG